MPEKLDWSISVTIQQLSRKAGNADFSARLLPRYEQTLELGQSLVQPRAVFEEYPVKAASNSFVRLAEGTQFFSHQLAKRLRCATRLVAVCWTIGGAVEHRAQNLMEDGDILGGYLLDTYGSLATSELGRAVYRHLTAQLCPGEKATVPLAPGQLDWPASDQAAVARLAGARRIGITLTPHSMMVPVKSGSAVFGIGPESRVRRGEVACADCPKQDECPYSRTTHQDEMQVE